MNAAPRRNRRTIGPIATLFCAGLVAIAALHGAGAQAEGVPTPSETSVATTTVADPIAASPSVTLATTPTGTTLPVEP